MIPCRIVTDASQATDAAIPLRVYNPETNTTETVALVVETDGVATETPTEVACPLSVVDFGAAQEDATVKYTNVKRETSETTEPPAVILETPSLSSEMRFPLHHAGQSALLNPSPPTLSAHQDFRVLHSHPSPAVVTGDHEKSEIHGNGPSIGMFLPDRGEVQFIDAPPPHPQVFGDASSHLITNEAVHTALRNAYLTGLYNGLSASIGSDGQIAGPFDWPTLFASPRPFIDPRTSPGGMGELKRKSRDAVKRTQSKRGRRAKFENRTCRNCGTRTTPFWRKDRFSGDPLCNACGLYLTKNDDHRPASLWQQHAPSSRS